MIVLEAFEAYLELGKVLFIQYCIRSDAMSDSETSF
jgi:hypothetical protein